MRRRLTGLLMVPLVAVLAACGADSGDDGPTAVAASEVSTTKGVAETSPDAPPDGLPAFPTGTARQVDRDTAGSLLVLTDVRVADHDGFDRIVMEFSGPGTPGWSIDYVDRGRLDGSGQAVELGGDAVLDIYAAGTTYPVDDGSDGSLSYDGPRRLEAPAGGGISDVYVGGTFEGDTQVLAGIDGDRVPFRVFTLTAPTRLVVDVVDASDG